MDFFEIGIYLTIVVIAAVSVFAMLWFIIRSMAPRRRKSGRTSRAMLKAGRSMPGNQNGKGKSKDKFKGKGNKLMELSEYPESKLLPDKPKPDEGEQKRKAADENISGNVVDQIAAGAAVTTAAAKAEIKSAEVNAENQQGAAQEEGEIALPDLPSLDTLTDEEEELPKEEIDLMSVFESEDSEDSATSDLAANLFDVDVQNIEKLGSEVSQFLGGLR